MTIIARIYCGKIMASFYFDDYMNTDNSCIWLEKVLCPELCPKQVVIMDNASFHKSHRIWEIIEHVDCQLFYLSHYSPDFNLIEHSWAWLKNKISYLWGHATDFYDRFSSAFNRNYGVTLISSAICAAKRS
jgi:transposase